MDEAMYMVKILYCQSVMRMITKHTTADNKEVNTAGKIYFFTKNMIFKSAVLCNNISLITELNNSIATKTAIMVVVCFEKHKPSNDNGKVNIFIEPNTNE